MKHFFFVVNTSKEATVAFANELLSYLRQRGAEATMIGHTELTSESVPKDCECILILGGDGTLIRAATKIVGLQLPVIGINLGTLGYLCELDETTAFDAMDRLILGEGFIEERMMLDVALEGAYIGHFALNDVVIHGAGRQQFSHLAVRVNGEPLAIYHADGIIISTPTGSTGYNMSAGGPIVDPKAKMLLLTPINEHNLGSKSLVLDAEDKITVELLSRRSDQKEAIDISADGDAVTTLGVGEKVIIQMAKPCVKVLRLNRTSFLENLRKKMER